MAKGRIERERTLEKNAENAPQKPSLRPLLNELVRRPGRSQKAFAIDGGTSEPAVSDGLAGRKALDIDLLIGQDDAFLLDFIDGLIALRGLTPEAKRIARANQIAELTRLMHLSGERREERVG